MWLTSMIYDNDNSMLWIVQYEVPGPKDLRGTRDLAKAIAFEEDFYHTVDEYNLDLDDMNHQFCAEFNGQLSPIEEDGCTVLNISLKDWSTLDDRIREKYSEEDTEEEEEESDEDPK